jgi:EpsD family peptidyl-prolyl cis-trans isomerase
MPTSSVSRHVAATLAATVVTLGILALAGCGDDKKVATQVAAKVNKEEISVHQINNVLGRAGNLPPEQMKVASRQVLDRLVDQELLVQKATEKKLDREPKTMQAIEAARRDILARAYMENASAALAKPTSSEIGEFYAKRPELFSERRLYSLQELTIAGNPAELLPKLQGQLGKAKALAEVAAWLKTENIPFNGNATTKAAEQLPLELLSRFHQMKDGQIGVVPSKDGVLVVQLLASRTVPMDQNAATPFIEQFLMNQKKVETSNRELKQLREQAKIEYLGEFAKTEAAAKAEAPVAKPAAVAAAPAAAPIEAAVTAPAAAQVRTPAAAAAIPNASALEKGVAGLK